MTRMKETDGTLTELAAQWDKTSSSISISSVEREIQVKYKLYSRGAEKPTRPFSMFLVEMIGLRRRWRCSYFCCSLDTVEIHSGCFLQWLVVFLRLRFNNILLHYKYWLVLWVRFGVRCVFAKQPSIHPYPFAFGDHQRSLLAFVVVSQK